MGTKIKSCAIITGAPENEIQYYKNHLDGRFIISADSGYKKCVKLGLEPDLIIGDFDSSEKPQTDAETIVLPVRKDDTDTFYSVKEAVKRGFNDILILGGIGSRIDHTYDNILCLNYCADRNINAVMLNKNNKIRVLTNDTIFESDGYKYFSLFALFGDCVDLTITGAEYNVTDYTLTADCPLAQSNELKDEKVQLKFKSGKILLIQSND
ncbi:MAG: thiamine diphosphokinase [Eubacteriales bacterium]|nr:thiamine diphosphokinase [Eubacteriales bacterium]